MIKKFLLVAFALFMTHSAYGIQWTTVESPNGSKALLDVDSIKVYKRYYLYNIKVLNSYTNKNVVITMQSNMNSGLSARIKYYNEKEYDELNGDYDNMQNNITKTFEPVQFGSLAHSCYLKVKSIKIKNDIQISM